MKNISNVLQYLPKRLSIIVATILIAIATNFAVGASATPPVFTWTGDDTTGGDQVQFNAFTNNPVWGDERDFVRGSVDGRDSSKTDPVNDVKDGDIVDVVVFVHNVIDGKYNESGDGIAKNTTVKVTLPGGNALSQNITATVNADNAAYGAVTDTVTLNSAGHFELEPIAGSGRINGNFDTNTPVDVNALVNGGVNIGDISGCFEYIRFVSFKVKVNAPRYTIEKEVRHEGSGPGNWKQLVDAEIGDKIEWSIGFTNAGSTVLEDVKIVDNIPAGHKVVPGSVQLRNYTYPDSAIQANGKQINVDINDYAPGAKSYLYFTTTVVKDAALKCGVIRVQNVAYATPAGYGAISDDAFTVIDTGVDCNPTPTPEYSCDALTASKMNIKVGGSVDFTARASAKNGAKIDHYSFNFGDGSDKTVSTSSNTANASHTYNKVGTYTAEVAVWFDVNGKSVVDSSGCKVTITVEKEVVIVDPVYSCDALTASALTINTGKSVDFGVRYTATPADRVSADSFGLSINGAPVTKGGGVDGTISRTFDKSGTYTIEAIIDFTVDGDFKAISSPSCMVTITVTDEVIDPVYSCDALVKSGADGVFKLAASASAEHGAVVKSYDFNFGDGNNETVTTSSNFATTADHTYAPGNYTATVTVSFTVNGEVVTAGGNACTTPIVVEEEIVDPVYECVALEATSLLQIGEKATFKATAVAKNGATIKDYTFNYGDGTVETIESSTPTHTYAKAGNYTAGVMVNVIVNGEAKSVTSNDCVVQIEVEKPEDPTFRCVSIETTALSADLKARVKVVAEALNGAKVSQISFDYGDNTSPFVTNNFTAGENGQSSIVTEHTYAEAGSYTITAKILFTVDGETKHTICVAQVEVEETPEVCKYDSAISADDSNCKEEEKTEKKNTPLPTVLPNTGIGSAIFGIFGISAIGAMLRGWLASRRALSASLLG